MYQLDFATCTAFDVIRRSACVHPTLFGEALFDAARAHDSHAALTHNADAERIARGMAANARKMAEAVLVMPDADCIAAYVVGLGAGPMVQAFHAAVSLQCIPRAEMHDIIARPPVATV